MNKWCNCKWANQTSAKTQRSKIFLQSSSSWLCNSSDNAFEAIITWYTNDNALYNQLKQTTINKVSKQTEISTKTAFFLVSHFAWHMNSNWAFVVQACSYDHRQSNLNFNVTIAAAMLLMLCCCVFVAAAIWAGANNVCLHAANDRMSINQF